MDSDLRINRVHGHTGLKAEDSRRMHAALFLDWILDIQQYDHWKVADYNAAHLNDIHLAASTREEAQVKAQLRHTDATRWHEARNVAMSDSTTALADVAHAQTGQLGPCAAPEQVVRKVGAIEAEMRKGHIFISGNDPHEVEIERLGMSDDDEVSGASETKHVWQVFMEHQRRDKKRRS